MIQKWKTTSSKQIADYHIFTAFEKNRVSPVSGKTHTFFVLEAKDWAGVIAITPDDKAVMVRQYRHGIDDITLEFPAGTADDDDPDMTAAIQRELLEETGYAAKKIIPLGVVDTDAAFLTNKCHFFVAYNATKQDIQHLDETEDIETEEVPLADIPRLIASGQIANSLSIAAYFFQQAHVAKNAESSTGL